MTATGKVPVCPLGQLDTSTYAGGVPAPGHSVKDSVLHPTAGENPGTDDRPPSADALPALSGVVVSDSATGKDSVYSAMRVSSGRNKGEREVKDGQSGPQGEHVFTVIVRATPSGKDIAYTTPGVSADRPLAFSILVVPSAAPFGHVNGIGAIPPSHVAPLLLLLTLTVQPRPSGRS